MIGRVVVVREIEKWIVQKLCRNRLKPLLRVRLPRTVEREVVVVSVPGPLHRGAPKLATTVGKEDMSPKIATTPASKVMTDKPSTKLGLSIVVVSIVDGWGTLAPIVPNLPGISPATTVVGKGTLPGTALIHGWPPSDLLHQHALTGISAHIYAPLYVYCAVLNFGSVEGQKGS